MRQMPASRTRYTLDPILRWPSANAREWTRDLLERAVADPAIRAVIAIGSSVKPSVSSSDLDLIVLFGNQAPDLKRVPIDVDIRAYSVENIDELLDTGNDLLSWAVKFGEPLLDKDSIWEATSRMHRESLQLPAIEPGIARMTRIENVLTDLLSIGDEDAAAEQLVSLLTHMARNTLIERGVFPASRPELPAQLRAIDQHRLASLLEEAARGTSSPDSIYRSIRG